MKYKFVLLTILAVLLASCSAPATPTPAALPPVAADLSVVADGRLLPAQSLELSFATGGQVAQVLVAENDTVAAGTPIAQLKSSETLQAQLKQAVAGLASAQNNYQSLTAGATYHQLQAALANAQMELLNAQQALTDLTDKAAVAAAQANQAVAVAQSNLTQANKQVGYAQNPVSWQVTNTVSQTQVALRAAQNAALLNPVSADAQALVQATAQTNISFSAYQNLQAKWDGGNHADSLKTALEQAHAAYQQALDTKTQLELRIQTAQATQNQQVTDAQKAYDDAVNNLANAQVGPNRDKLAVTQANQKLAQVTLADAQAHAAKLAGGPDPELLASAQARLTSAQAGLASAQAAQAPAQVASAEAQVAAAEAQVAAAQAALTDSELRAPFAGTVAHLDLKVGQQVAPGQAVGTLADFSSWLVETSNLTEIEVVRISAGQAVTVTLDALPNAPLHGSVTAISPVFAEKQGDVTYTTRIKLADQQPLMRWGMTASVMFAK